LRRRSRRSNPWDFEDHAVAVDRLRAKAWKVSAIAFGLLSP
jgi:hypothetical protein